MPKEYEDSKPDFALVASKLIMSLRKHFMGRKIGLRLLSSREHPGKPMDEIIRIIKGLGHDRYDPQREGDRYGNIENKDIDIFALDFVVGNKKDEECVRNALESFYYYPIFDGRGPIRVDIAIVYDLAQLKAVEHRYLGRENEVKKDGFVFRHKGRKHEAVLAILKIL